MERKSIKMDPPGKMRVTGYPVKPAAGIKEKTGATAEEIRKAVEVVGFDRVKVEEYIKSHNQHS